MKRLLQSSIIKRFLFFFLFDSAIIVASLYLSFLFRFDFTLPDGYPEVFIRALPLFLTVKLSLFVLFKMYKITWRNVGISDLQNIILALTASESMLMVLILIPMPLFLTSQLPNLLNFNFSSPSIPRSIFLIDWAVSVILLSGLRISKRVFQEIIMKKRFTRRAKKTIIIGAGNTGEMILRDITRKGFSDFYPVGFLDDDTKKIGMYIHGIRVIGSTAKLENSIKRYGIEAIIIAIPALNHKLLVGFYRAAKEAKVETVKIVPRVYDFHKPGINLKNLEDISMEDLIGRQIVNVDYKEIGEILRDKVILVTGAGGSIGSEIVIQVCAFQPQKIILFDIDETELHNLEIKLKRVISSYESRNQIFFSIVGDVRDIDRVEGVFKRFNPHIVFHAAAYKHVPMMEYNPSEAVKVNMCGTYILSRASIEHGVKKFIMISTDKAVRPTSIMGATKRMAEHICKAFNEDNRSNTEARSQSDFISVRFGNVLGSSGSVLHLFLEQLKYGGPLTVTHKDMKRYFMTIHEAVSLVLQASVIGKGGDVLVLDMGTPVTIVSLAEELIRLHGLEPYRDVDIEIIGLRPGEKLFEEVLTAEEEASISRHEKVFIAKNSERYSKDEIKDILEEFEAVLKDSSIDGDIRIRDLLKRYVRQFDRNN